jgi:8-oxo-dGTP pyrophosphatase MutT (NUDIX family)
MIEETGHPAEPTPLDLTQSFLIESQFLEARYPAPIIASEVVYRAELDSRLPIRIDPLEHDDWGWFTMSEAQQRIRWTDDREALEKLSGNGSGSLPVVASQFSSTHRPMAS